MDSWAHEVLAHRWHGFGAVDIKFVGSQILEHRFGMFMLPTYMREARQFGTGGWAVTNKEWCALIVLGRKYLCLGPV